MKLKAGTDRTKISQRTRMCHWLYTKKTRLLGWGEETVALLVECLPNTMRSWVPAPALCRPSVKIHTWNPSTGRWGRNGKGSSKSSLAIIQREYEMARRSTSGALIISHRMAFKGDLESTRLPLEDKSPWLINRHQRNHLQGSPQKLRLVPAFQPQGKHDAGFTGQALSGTVVSPPAPILARHSCQWTEGCTRQESVCLYWAQTSSGPNWLLRWLPNAV